MTREEREEREEREDAIDIIQSVVDKYEEDECLATEITIGDEDIKAFKMAIKALEQEPTVTSTNNGAEMVYPQVEGITPTVINEDIYQCSCGYGWDKNKVIRFHFCPNCGKAVDNDYKYIKNISNPTGIEFDEEQEEFDFVRPHKRIPVTLTISSDCISRQTVKEQMIKYGFHAPDMTVTEFVEDLPPVNPSYSDAELNTIQRLEQAQIQKAYELGQEDRPTGHWILADEQNKEDVENDNYRFICSECQYSDIHAKGTIVPYCWKCGCRMIEPQESEG